MMASPPRKPSTLPPGSPAAAPSFGPALANWLFPAYVLLILAGYFVLRSPAASAAGNEITVDRALFAAVNAATLTGFQNSVGMEQYRPAAVATMLALTFGGTLLSLAIGSLAVVRVARLPFTDWQILRSTLFVTAIAIGAGSLALLPGRPVPDAMFLAASSFANSGLFTGALPPSTGWQTQAVALPLAILGGIGLPVLMELLLRLFRRGQELSPHARVALASYAGVYVATMLVVFLIRLATSSSGGDAGPAFADASVTAANTRTLGLPLQPVASLGRTVQWLLIAVMAIGGAPGGTAGGLKVTIVPELWRGVRRALRGETPGRTFGIAATWLGIYTLIILVALLILLTTEPNVPADRLLFHVVSAASNVGLSFDPISTVGRGLYVLTLAMFLGRIVPLLVLWWQADTDPDAEAAIG